MLIRLVASDRVDARRCARARTLSEPLKALAVEHVFRSALEHFSAKEAASALFDARQGLPAKLAVETYLSRSSRLGRRSLIRRAVCKLLDHPIHNSFATHVSRRLCIIFALHHRQPRFAV